MAYIGANPQVSLQEYLTIDDISGDFDGVETSFALLVGGVAPVPGPKQSNQLLISLNGVIQEPDDTGSAGFRLSGGNIIFSSAPSAATPFFGVALAGADYVYAGTNFPDGSVTSPSITFANDLDSGFYRTGSGELAYTSNGTFRLKIDSSGRLGVGTSSPAQALHVAAASNDIARFESTTTNGSATIELKPQSTSGLARIDVVDNACDFSISTVGKADALVVKNGGNVGVGTTSPSRNLVVNGGASSGIFQLTNNTSGTGSAQGWEVVHYTNGETQLINRENAPMAFYTNNTQRLRIESTGAWNFIGSGTPGTSQTVSFNASAPTNSIFLDSSGRLGLGTSSPLSGAQLTVAGAALAVTGQNTAHSANSIRIGEEGSGLAQIRCYGPDTSTKGSLKFTMSPSNGSSNADVVIDSSGRVGIGTTSPQTGLQVGDYSGAHSITIGSSSTTNGAILFADGTTGNEAYRGYVEYKHTNDVLVFGTGGADKATIDGSGRLLVGTGTGGGNITVAATGDVALDIVADSDNNNTNNWPIINFRRNSTTGTPVARIYHREDATALTFDTAGTEHLRISDNGAFGLSGANYGTSGQVLTSQGSGSAPQWSTVNTQWTDHGADTLSGSGGTTVTGISTNARQVRVVFTDVSVNSSLAPQIVLRLGNGSISTSSYQGRVFESNSNGTQATGTSQINITHTGHADPGHSWSGIIEISMCGSGVTVCWSLFTNLNHCEFGAARWQGNNTIDRVNFFCSSGAFDAGVVKVFSDV